MHGPFCPDAKNRPSSHRRSNELGTDSPVAEVYEAMFLSQATTDIDKARLKATSSPHSGDWLSAAPITSKSKSQWA